MSFNAIAVDIETYKSMFCICYKGQQNGKEIKGSYIVSNDGNGFPTMVDPKIVKEFLSFWSKMKWGVTYNGKNFDLRVLCSIATHNGLMTTMQVADISENIINGKGFQGPGYEKETGIMLKKVRENHFDVLKGYTGGDSLKKWELRRNWSVKETNVPWDAEHMNREEIMDCVDYCLNHDVEATWRLFMEKECQELIEARQWVIDNAPCYIYPDSTAAELAETYCYGDKKTDKEKESTYELIPWNDFDVPYDFLMKMKSMANGEIDGFNWNGADFGKGGAHYAKPGRNENVKIFDVASLYPHIIKHFVKLKTPEALERYVGCIEKRLENKRKKGTSEYSKPADKGLKLVLNSLSGKFGMPGANAFAPNHRLAMCMIGQLTIVEAAWAATNEGENWDDLIEINTDSFAVVGDDNIKRAREYTAKKLHGFTFEEDNFDDSYWKDVNNYWVYNPNEDDRVTDMLNQNKFVKERHGPVKTNFEADHSELIVTESLGREVRKPDGSKPALLDCPVTFENYAVKYSRPKNAENVKFGNETFKKSYCYILYTTEDCPNSVDIRYTGGDDYDDDGLISVRHGVWGYDPDELRKYEKYIDKDQYLEDLKHSLIVWGRKDMVSGDITGIKGNGKSFASCRAAKNNFFDSFLF